MIQQSWRRLETSVTDPGQAALGQFDLYREAVPRYLLGQRGLSENTEKVYMADLCSFRQYLANENLGLEDMDRQTLRGFLAWLSTNGKAGQQGYARVSVARKLTVVRAFYRFLVQEGLFRSTPVPSGQSFKVKLTKTLPKFLGQREVSQLMDMPDEDTIFGVRDKAILETLYACGIRLAEIHGLNLSDINFPRKEILVRGKGSKERLVLFGRSTKDALDIYIRRARRELEARPCQALFLNRYGGRLSKRSYEKLVRRYSALVRDHSDIHPHTLRHSFATHMLEGGADLRVIQELLGHSSPTTTQVYTHITKQEALTAYLEHHPRADEPVGKAIKNEESKDLLSTQKDT